ncbi:MAG: hypothetical protein FWE23_08725 [Chitinivibrionia bacterium]|nr:hypothetical protein [Chitinivibrionia bacterium]
MFRMKKIAFIMLVALVFSAFAFEQSRIAVGIPMFSTEAGMNENLQQYARAVTENVVALVTSSRRFTVVNRTGLDMVDDELRFQRTDNSFLDNFDFQVRDEAIAAEKLIMGHINNLAIQLIRNPNGSIAGYRANVSLTLNVTNVETREATESRTFNGVMSPQMATIQSALTSSLNSLNGDISNWLKAEFPVETAIAEITETRRNSARNVRVFGAADYGFSVGSEFNVVSVREISGRTLRSTIGTIKITSLSGDFSEAEVLSGGEEILTQFNAGATILCQLQVSDGRGRRR